MGLTSALNTSLNALSLNETAISIIGNNIANANTTGFKSSDIEFATQLSQTLSFGSAPNGTIDGGTNPVQVGLGATTAAVSTNFGQGSLETTNNPANLAIQGDGLFVLQSAGGPVYSRDGSFSLSSSNQLQNSQGLPVQGFAVDSNYNLVTTGTSNISIPLGQAHIAQATSNVAMTGALDPTGQVATQGTLQTSQALIDSSNNSAAITSGSLLINVEQSGSTTPLFTAGQTLSFSPTKGGATLGTKTLKVTSTTTMQNLEDFMTQTLGLQSVPASETDADGISVGASITAGGQIQIKGNRGTVNDFNIPVGSLTSNGTAVPLSFTPGPNRANGESTATSFTVYDSLGTPLTVRMSAVLDSVAPNATTFRYFLESPDQQNPTPSGGGAAPVSIALGTGTITFNSQGQEVTSGSAPVYSINRAATGAVSPLNFALDLTGISGISSGTSNLALKSQDGTSPGTLTSYVIDSQGRINGSFDNGVTRVLGQVVLAHFANPQGLIQDGSNTFSQGLGSGVAQVGPPGANGTGSIQSSSLELSNTDVSKSLVDLINVSTNYQSDAQVLNTTNQLLNQLLTIVRNG